MRALLFASVFLLACSGDDSTLPDGSTGDAGADAPTADASNDAAVETGPVLCNGVVCQANEVCFQSTSCVCAAGYVPNGSSGCVAAPSGSPGTHTQADVCARWKAGHVVTTPSPYTAGATQCDPGTLAAGGITDTLSRIDAFRWIAGLGDTVTDSATLDTGDQDCAIIAVWNPASLQAHNPPPSYTCYNSAGAAAAGQSNISWGVSSPDSIDLYVQDTGNETTLGHRRWILHPPLGVVGVGWVQASGTQYGRAGCVDVFDSSGTGPKPTWYAWPPQGYVPLVAADGWEWSFHYHPGMSTATATVKDMGTGQNVSITTAMLPSGYGDDTFEITLPGSFKLTAGDIYRVTVTPGNAAPIVYDVEPVSCP
jgi:hypothetical protein